MKLTKYSQLKHGMKVRAVIKGEELEGKISVNEEGKAYLCHNDKRSNGFSAFDKLGYKYSLLLAYEREDIEYWPVDSLEALDDDKPRTIRDLREGDIIVNEYGDKAGDEAKVLEVRGDWFMRSNWGDFEKEDFVYTLHQAEFFGWRLKDERVKLTKQEIADKFGIEVDSLEIVE